MEGRKAEWDEEREFVASPEASYITSAGLTLDGGINA
jgi:hypothetical protein